ncbi:DcrB-related protein, partial [Pseudomonas syringae group genomosp. 7]|uniref:DcrB-related protein n=1 Tax=Pseudomonas syringae group genomosp. 7 TaxID=251699 RepID=UPI00376FF287
NFFLMGSTLPAPLCITVSRDTQLPSEQLKTYVDRQVKILSSKLRGYTLLNRIAVSLSTVAPLEGIQIDAYYMTDGRA